MMQRQNDPGSSQARRAPGAQESYASCAAEAAHEGVEKLKERLEPGEERLREAAASAEETLRDAGAHAKETYKALADETRAYVREHPLTAAALAFAAGVVVISWIRR